MTDVIETAAEASMLIDRLQQGVWQLAALTVALRDDSTETERTHQAQQVLVALGLMAESPAGLVPAPGLNQLVSGGRGDLAEEAATNILQAAGLLTGATAWGGQSDGALLAQGRTSAQGVAPFKMFLLPALTGLTDLISGGRARMLDVGVGVAELAVAYCRAFPGLCVVGLDVLPRALELARLGVDEAKLAERIELRQQDVGSFDDEQTFALVWLPAPFIPRGALTAGLPRLVNALVPGGWLMMGHGKFHDDKLKNALSRFQTSVYGGTSLDDQEAQELLRGAALEEVFTFPTPEGAPAITVGRRSLGESSGVPRH